MQSTRNPSPQIDAVVLPSTTDDLLHTAEPRPESKRPRLRSFLKSLAIFALGIITGIGAVAYWAANQYIVDDIAIEDTTAFQAELAANTREPSADDGATAATADEVAATADRDTVEITTVEIGDGDNKVTYFVADVLLDDVTELQTGFANDQFGQNIIANTSEIAADNDASFAINGDYYGFRDTGIVIRNGVLFRDEPARAGLAIYADGTMQIYDETETSGEQLIADGVWQTISFGPALLDDGEIVDGIEDVEVDTNLGRRTIQGAQPRTGIGMIDANHFVFVVVDGRSDGYSRGVTMTEFAKIFESLGATEAYNIDGGGSSTMVYEDELVNNPLGEGEERGTSDILYIG